MNRVVIYARVSSTGDRQSTERQVADLTRYSEASGMEVVAVYDEKASGAKRDREKLAKCLEFLKGGGADTLLVSELSRLGRSLRQVLEIIEDMTEVGIDIYFQGHHFRRGPIIQIPEGRQTTIGGLSSKREFIISTKTVQRIKNALNSK